MTEDIVARLRDPGRMIGRSYLERGRLVVVLARWTGKGPRNVLIRRDDGSLVVRTFRGLRRPAHEAEPCGLCGLPRRDWPRYCGDDADMMLRHIPQSECR